MTYFGSPAKLIGRRELIESGEAIVRTSRALHVFGVAALALALVDGGSVHARRAPSQPLSAAAIGQGACSPSTPPQMTTAATFNAEVLPDRLDIYTGIIYGETRENGG